MMQKKLIISVALIGCVVGVFANNDYIGNAKDRVFKKYINHKAKDVHVKSDGEKQSIAEYFVKSGLLEADVMGGFELKQRNYPEPVTLRLQEVPSAAVKQIKATQDWENSGVAYCYANSWARYDAKSKRVLINVESISCEHQKIEFGESRGWIGSRINSVWQNIESSNVGAKINGEIFGADFVKGVQGKLEENGIIEVRYNTKVLIKFKEPTSSKFNHYKLPEVVK